MLRSRKVTKQVLLCHVITTHNEKMEGSQRLKASRGEINREPMVPLCNLVAAFNAEYFTQMKSALQQSRLDITTLWVILSFSWEEHKGVILLIVRII